jgi:hypothetical protein
MFAFKSGFRLAASMSLSTKFEPFNPSLAFLSACKVTTTTLLHWSDDNNYYYFSGFSQYQRNQTQASKWHKF